GPSRWAFAHEAWRRAIPAKGTVYRNSLEQNSKVMSAPSIAEATSLTCWNCSASTGGAHFCPACGKIQPLLRAADFFAFFGLPQKLTIDLADLEQRFHSLSWKLHPDHFVRASDEESQLSLDLS